MSGPRLPTDIELASLAALQEQMHAAMRPIDDVLQSLLERVAPTELMKDLVENVRALTGGLGREFEGFRRMLREYEALEERAAPVLQVAGWPIVPSWPMWFVVELFTAAIDERRWR
jgi:actin-like ATPase involved in cell morphogenesis